MTYEDFKRCITAPLTAIQNSLWYMIPSIVTIVLGNLLIEYYARNYDKFKD
jgi:hypothetical protein